MGKCGFLSFPVNFPKSIRLLTFSYCLFHTISNISMLLLEWNAKENGSFAPAGNSPSLLCHSRIVRLSRHILVVLPLALWAFLTKLCGSLSAALSASAFFSRIMRQFRRWMTNLTHFWEHKCAWFQAMCTRCAHRSSIIMLFTEIELLFALPFSSYFFLLFHRVSPILFVYVDFQITKLFLDCCHQGKVQWHNLKRLHRQFGT